MRISTCTACAMAVALFLFLATAAMAESVRVTSDRSTVWRNTTGTGGIMVIVRAGTILEVRGRQGRWLLVKHPTDPRQVGFILAQQTEPVDPIAGVPTAPTELPPAAATVSRPPAGASPTGPGAPPRELKRLEAKKPRQPFMDGAVSLQASSLNFTGTSTTSTLFEEEVRTSRFGVSKKPGIEVGGGFPIRRLLVSGAVTRRSGSARGEIEAEIPSPIFYGQPRTLAVTTSASRVETAAHARISIPMYKSERFEVFGGLGPSMFFVTQDIVDQLGYEEEYPYTSVSFTNASMRPSTGHALGFNAELDAVGPISRRVSWLTSFRWSEGSVAIDGLQGRVRAGRGQFSAGLRYWLR